MDSLTTSTTPNNFVNYHALSSPSPSTLHSNQQQRSEQNPSSHVDTNGTRSSNTISSKQTKPTAAPRSSLSSTKQPQQPEGILKPSVDMSHLALSNPTDAHFQSMFLESVPNLNRGLRGASTNSNSGNQLQFYPPPMMEKAKNGQYNNNNYSSSVGTTTPSANSGLGGVQAVPVGPTANGPRTSFREGQLRRFVAPSGDPAVGSDEDGKQRCCVIL